MRPTTSSELPTEGEPDWTLDGGIDPSAWTEEIRDALSALRQGSLIQRPPFAYYANGARPLFGMTRDWAQNKGATEGTVSAASDRARPPFGIITTQTCDLVEEGSPKRPWVQLSPVYFRRCPPGEARRIREGRAFTYLVWTSALGEQDHGVWVADLRVSIPVEKGWLVGCVAKPGFRDSEGFDAFAERLAHLAARPAYPRVVNKRVLMPLRDRLELLCKEYPEGDGIEEVRLELGHDRLDPESVCIVFIGHEPIPQEVQEALSSWWGSQFAETQPPDLTVLAPEFTTYEAVGAYRYSRLDPLDLSFLSPVGNG